jgi:hypothetical protein
VVSAAVKLNKPGYKNSRPGGGDSAEWGGVFVGIERKKEIEFRLAARIEQKRVFYCFGGKNLSCARKSKQPVPIHSFILVLLVPRKKLSPHFSRKRISFMHDNWISGRSIEYDEFLFRAKPTALFVIFCILLFRDEGQTLERNFAARSKQQQGQTNYG